MSTIERDVVLQGQEDGKETIDLPITRLGNIEDGAQVKDVPTAGDYIPVMDGEENGQMKKSPWSAIAALFAKANHTHTAQTTVSGNAGTATKLKTARKIGNASFDGSKDITLADMGAAASEHTHTAADVGALASGGTAAAATKLATARTIRTNLASTATASFNGTANVTPGVTGTLPIANGGTGATTAAAALTALGAASTDQMNAALDQLHGKAQVAIISHTGVHKSGPDYPSVFTFPFAPLALIHLGHLSSDMWELPIKFPYAYSFASRFFLDTSILTTQYKRYMGLCTYDATNIFGKKSKDGKTFYFYSEGFKFGDTNMDVHNQLNSSYETYYILAIG